MAGRNAQERFRILERRKRVAAMYLQGMSQWEIGRQLGVTQQCIAKDIQALEKEWLASAVVAIDAAKAKELASTKAPVVIRATVEAVGPVNVHSLTGLGMTPGDVLQHD